MKDAYLQFLEHETAIKHSNLFTRIVSAITPKSHFCEFIVSEGQGLRHCEKCNKQEFFSFTHGDWRSFQDGYL